MQPDEPSPIQDALAQLAKLAAAGAAPEQVVQAVGEIVAGWASEAEMNPETAQDRVAQMWDSVSRDAAGLQEQISDSGGADQPGLAGAQRTLGALHAAELALATAHDRF